MELFEVIEEVYAKNLAINPEFYSDAKSTIDAAAKKYGQLVYSYVEAIFDHSLEVQPDNKLVNEQDFELYNIVKNNPEYRSLLIKMVTAHIITTTYPAYRPYAAPDVKLSVYMNYIKTFATMYQIRLLAEYYDKHLMELETNIKR